MDVRARLLLALGVVSVAVVLVIVPAKLATPVAFLDAAPALFVVIAALGYGGFVLRALGAFAVLDRERWVWSAVLGLGVIGTAESVLAHLQQFNASSSSTLLAFGIAALAVQWRDLTADLAAPRDLGLGFLAVLAPFAALVILRASAPPSFYDALVYHLALPMQFAARGGAVVDVHDIFTAMPLLSEMAASPALLLGGPEGTGFVAAAEWFLLAVSVVVLVRRAFPTMKPAGGAAALITASTPLAVFLSSATKPDLLAAVFTVAVLRAMARVFLAPDGPSRAPWARIGALSLGFACACKTTFLVWAFLVVAVAVVLSLRAPRPIGGRAALVDLALLCAGGAFPYVRNAIALHNPVYPFAASIFGGPAWLAQTATSVASDAHRVRSFSDLVDALALPWQMSVSLDDPNTDELLGVAWLVGVLALFIARPGNVRALKLWAALAALTVPAWLLTSYDARYDPLLWIVAGVAGGLGVQAARDKSRVAGVLVVVAVVLACGIDLCWSMAADEIILRGPMAVIVQKETRRQFLERALEPMGAYELLNERARGGCVLLVTGDPRRAYLEVPALPSESYARPAVDEIVTESSSPDDALARIRAAGVSHILVGNNAAALLGQRGWARFDEAAQARFDAIAAGFGTAAIYSDAHERVFAVPDAHSGPCALGFSR